MSEHIFIDGIGLSGYRSFGNQLQRIGPFKKINLFIGKNNSGKSNINLFLKAHYSNIRRYISKKNNEADRENFLEPNFIPLDYHRFSDSQQFTSINIEFGFRSDKFQESSEYIDQYFYSSLFEQDSPNAYTIQKRIISKLLIESSVFFCNDKKLLCFFCNFKKEKYLPTFLSRLNESVLQKQEWEFLYSGFTGLIGNDFKQEYYDIADRFQYEYGEPNYERADEEIKNHVLKCIGQKILSYNIPQINMIPAIRKIGEAGTDSDDLSGTGIINKLSQLQNPVQNPDKPGEYQHLKNNFEKINQFLQMLIDNSRARIEIPHDKSVILVHVDNRTLPIESLGTGIHEVIILAAAATVLENQVICMEEPELHLHPLLQKKLIRYLQEETNNQYFITTHSAHFLDAPDVAIFHVRLENGPSSEQVCVYRNREYGDH